MVVMSLLLNSSRWCRVFIRDTVYTRTLGNSIINNARNLRMKILLTACVLGFLSLLATTVANAYATFPNGHMGQIIAIDRVERSIIIRDAESSDSIRISMTDNNRMMSQLMLWSVSNSVFVQYEDRDGSLFAIETERLQ